jgi:hypothetical protein
MSRRKLSLAQSFSRRRVVAWVFGVVVGAFVATRLLSRVKEGAGPESSTVQVFDAGDFELAWNFTKESLEDGGGAVKAKASRASEDAPSLAAELKTKDPLVVLFTCPESSVYGIDGSKYPKRLSTSSWYDFSFYISRSEQPLQFSVNLISVLTIDR